MIQIHIDVKGDDAKALLAKAPHELNKILESSFADWALRTANKAKGRAPYVTGNLAQSIMATKEGTGASTSANVEYAKYVEPEPLGVPMTRKMTRTQYLYNSAMEELDTMVTKLEEKINNYLNRR